MDLNEYQQLASRTLIDKPDRLIPDEELQLIHAAIAVSDSANQITACISRRAMFAPQMPGYDPDKTVMGLWVASGLAGEAGEVLDALKKGVFHQHGIDKVSLTKEIGDLMWYLSGICSVCRFSLDTVWTHGQPPMFCGMTLFPLLDLVRALKLLVGYLGLDISEIMQVNIEKLKARYPEGYSAEASIKRAVV